LVSADLSCEAYYAARNWHPTNSVVDFVATVWAASLARRSWPITGSYHERTSSRYARFILVDRYGGERA